MGQVLLLELRVVLEFGVVLSRAHAHLGRDSSDITVFMCCLYTSKFLAVAWSLDTGSTRAIFHYPRMLFNIHGFEIDFLAPAISEQIDLFLPF